MSISFRRFERAPATPADRRHPPRDQTALTRGPGEASFVVSGLFILLLLLLLPLPSLANPEGGRVAGGNASISSQAQTLTVNQHTDKAVINWQNFSIGADETTRFVQPSKSAVALNRVVTTQPSAIFGALEANGHLFVVNPNGVVFGQGSRVDVNGLVVSTHDISDTNFMRGDFRFDIPGRADAEIFNQGEISVGDASLAAFVAPTVRNDGIIQARLGKVVLAAGTGFALDLYGDGLLELQVEEEHVDEMLRVEHTGLIEAESVLLTAGTARRVVDSVINLSGSVQTRTARQEGGRIVIGGSTGVSTDINISGTLDAAGSDGTNTAAGGEILVAGGGKVNLHDARLDVSGTGSGGSISVAGATAAGGSTVLLSGQSQLLADGAAGTGGQVTVTGYHTGLTDTTRINATGASGGGLAQIGGSWQGSNPEVPAATAVYVGPDVVVDASAGARGDGGTIAVWSDVTDQNSSTRAYGALFARGGEFGGNGGAVETSGSWLDAAGITVDAAAPAGESGLWLLDPLDLYVTTAPTTAPTSIPAPGDTLFTPVAGQNNVLNTDIENRLDAGTNVVLQTIGSAGAESGSIYVNADITKRGGAPASLVLEAAGSIIVDDNVSVSSINNSLDLLLLAGGDIALKNGSSINSNGGIVSLDGQGITLDGTIAGGQVSLSAAIGNTISGSGGIAANELLVLGPSSIELNTTAANNVDILTAAGVNSVSFSNGTALTISAISAAGTIQISTNSGNLIVAGDVITTDASVGAISLIAGQGRLAGDAAGGDIIISGTPTLTTGAGGSILLYTGSINDSTGLTELVGSGSQRFRYNADENTNFSASGWLDVAAPGLYGIYREQPQASITQINSQSMTYGDAIPVLSGTAAGLVNGDLPNYAVGAPVFSGSGNLAVIGSPYSVGETALAALGYSVFTSAPGGLTVNPLTLTLTGFAVQPVKPYDGTTTAAITNVGRFADLIAGDSVSSGNAGATYDTPEVGGNKLVTLNELSLSGEDASNYVVAGPATTTAAISAINSGPLVVDIVTGEDNAAEPEDSSDADVDDGPLTPEKVARMTPEQIRRIKPNQIHNMDAATARAFKPFQLRAFTTGQADALKPDHFQQFSGDQYRGFADGFVELKDEQVASLMPPEAKAALVRLAVYSRNELDPAEIARDANARELAWRMGEFTRQLQESEEMNAQAALLPWNPTLAAMRYGRWPLLPGMQFGAMRVGLFDFGEEPLVELAASVGEFFAETKSEKIFNGAMTFFAGKRALASKAARTMLTVAPVIGNLLALYTVISGKSPFTGEDVSELERSLCVLGTLPGAGALLKIAGKESAAVVRNLITQGQKLHLEKVEDVGETTNHIMEILDTTAAQNAIAAGGRQIEQLAEALLRPFLKAAA